MANLANTSIGAGAVADVSTTAGQSVLLAHDGPIVAFALANSAEVKLYSASKAGGARIDVPGTVLRLKNPSSAAVNYRVDEAV